MKHRSLRTKATWHFSSLIRKILAAWLIACTAQYLFLPRQAQSLAGVTALQQSSLYFVLAVGAIVLLLECLLSLFMSTGKLERVGILVSADLFLCVALSASFSWAFFGICALLLLIIAGFALLGWDGSEEKSSFDNNSKGRGFSWLTAGLALAFFLFVCGWTVGRYYSFSTPSYDFGIFSQMFYYLKTTLKPLTTLERDGLLSHFAVHVSPTYYLMLPFYWLFPSPITLQVLQAAVLTSAVIPAWKIGKNHGLSPGGRMLICVVLLLYPAYSGGTSYDLHENCFLTPLLLWLLFALERKNIPMTVLFALLTLGVKEDAAVYVAVVGLWLAMRGLLRSIQREKWNFIAGCALIAGAIGWFFLVTGYLSSNGEGVMTYRYDNFFFGGSASLLTLIQAVVMNPMKAVYECVDAEKLGYLAMTMLPLLGLPLFTRRYERYLLLIPYLLVNLMSDYPYQHNIFYQYSFGSFALLLYLTIVNLADIRTQWKRVTALVCAAAVSAAMFGCFVLPKGISYPAQCIQYRDYYQSIRDVLEQIPKDAKVASTTFYTAYLSQREVLYDVRYCTPEHLLEADYIVLSISSSDFQNYKTDGQNNGFGNLVNLLEENGYCVFSQYQNSLIIYCRNTGTTE